MNVTFSGGMLVAAAALVLFPAQVAAAGRDGREAARSASAKPSSPDRARPEKADIEDSDIDRADARLQTSEAATRVIDWVAASHDNGKLPFMVIDKQAGRLLLFDAAGKPVGEAPVLIGMAEGDDATPGVGSKKLSEIGPAEKTTPAGRFLAKYGWAAGNQKVLWVDYATSVALHAVVTGNKKERRQERLDSDRADDNRITYGCINVPVEFYKTTVSPLFKKAGGIVYVLPDSKPLEEVFPRVQVMPYL